MDELVVNGVTPEDFKILQKLIESYPFTLSSDLGYAEVFPLYNKINQIVEALQSD